MESVNINEICLGTMCPNTYSTFTYFSHFPSSDSTEQSILGIPVQCIPILPASLHYRPVPTLSGKYSDIVSAAGGVRHCFSGARWCK